MREEHLQILMFAWMIRNKSSVPHQIIQAKFGASPLQLNARSQAITYLHRAREFSSSSNGHHHLPWLALSSPRDQQCRYSHISSKLSHFCLDIDRLPPFQYSLDAPHMPLPLTRKSTRSSKRTYYSFIPSRHGWPLSSFQ